MGAGEHPAGAHGSFASAAGAPARRLWLPYSRAAIGELADLLGRGPVGGLAAAPVADHGLARRVVELGAGTGVLTGQLARSGVGAIAVEHDAAARAQLRRSLPAIPVLGAHPGRLPFADASVDALVLRDVAAVQVAAVAAELSRVARHGAPLVLIIDDEAARPLPSVPGPTGFDGPDVSEHHHRRADGGSWRSAILTWRRLR